MRRCAFRSTLQQDSVHFACPYEYLRQRESVLRVNFQHAYCKIILSGPLTERWADYLGDLLVDVVVEKGQIQTSTLIGQPHDLSAYVGILNVIANLGYTVIATEYQQAPLAKQRLPMALNPLAAKYES